MTWLDSSTGNDLSRIQVSWAIRYSGLIHLMYIPWNLMMLASIKRKLNVTEGHLDWEKLLKGFFYNGISIIRQLEQHS